MSELSTVAGGLAIAFGGYYITAWMWLTIPAAIVLVGIARGMADGLHTGIAAERTGSPASGGDGA